MPRFFVNVPYPMLLARIEDVVARGLSPEIVLDASTLDKLDRKQAHRLAERLQREGLENTLHAPFRDLSPGGADPKVRTVTWERFNQTVELADIFRPKCVVFHPGYDPWRFQDHERFWLQHSVETWTAIVEKAERLNLTLAVENVFENTPTTLVSLLQHVGSPHFRYCLDVGHLNVFGDVPLDHWVQIMSPYVVEIHLHDNNGSRDDHLPIGQGSIDFPKLCRLVRRYVKNEPLHCLEPAREEDLEPSIRGFTQLTGMSL